ncbi:MAG: glycosyltransferase family 2 protein [Deltaproteobacteria bacterium]|nr:glycosyltransferase family 2 protein [Deltaproteobacteria bacterium]
MFNNEEFSSAEKLMGVYRKSVDYEQFVKVDNRTVENPTVSVIIVAYHTNELLLECLKSLSNQYYKKYEIIVVDNGGNESVQNTLTSMSIMYVQCPMNVICAEGRNVGAYFAKGKYIAFLDDDTIVPNGYAKSIVQAFETYSIVGFRGKVLPRDENKNTFRPKHYDLGDIPVPSIIDTEGNSAFKRSIYLKMNGYNPLLFGAEGWELSFRIMEEYGTYVLIYWPDTVIYHDYAVSEEKRTLKKQRHAFMRKYISEKYPEAGLSREELKRHLVDDQSKRYAEELIPRNPKQAVDN